ncbi:MAG: hypothetical protein M1826_007212 [Phylliscum demangeonii]|nr:MAG: hypothetical protein M1826_007212 [Phylliscum demangeonii]
METEGAQPVARRLLFNAPLSWRAGKPIAIGELLRRLTTLSNQLRDLQQEEVDRESFTKVAKELAGPGLLAHKDKGVRAWTASCLVDILRLCAPDAPFTAAQLKDIFTLIVTSVLPALADPSNAYNHQHVYVLQSLAQVKSILLLADIPSSDTLTVHLFSSFFDILSASSKATGGEQLGTNVEYQMTAVLVILVDEAAHLPVEVVDVILAQFLRADPWSLVSGGNKHKRNVPGVAVDEKQSTLLLKELPPAYTMAKTICNSCPEKMARYVSQYFNDVIMDASSSVANGASKSSSHHRRTNNARHASEDEDDQDAHAGPTEEDLKDLNRAHRLLRELWRASPAVLQNVIPQLEAELSAENLQLRLLATETLGDMVAGIGAAGPPAPPFMDPAAYPPPTLDTHFEPLAPPNIFTIPSSPQPFPQAHPAAYHSFLSRKHDKSAAIRAAWTANVGLILSTSAGGIGLGQSDERKLIDDLATMLVDTDERVRVSAIKAIENFSLQDVVNRLGSSGSVDTEGSVLSNLAGRARDRKHAVRSEGIMCLGRIWAMAVGELAAGNEVVVSILGSIPSKLLDTFYVNDLDINLLLDHVLFELLLPLDYPPTKSIKSKMAAAGSPSREGDIHTNGKEGKEATNWDKIRTERILHLIRGLDAKAKKAFFAVQARQVQLANLLQGFLKRCEEYNGGVMDSGEAEINAHLTRLISYFAEMLPDAARASADLWKFVKKHDRRSYQLMRFCIDPSSEYRTVVKAIKELRKRVESALPPGLAGSGGGILETLTPLLYRASLLVYNKSQIPAVVELSRTDEGGLAQTAHEVLKEISTRHPEVFKAHVKELCRLLEEHSPTATNASAASDSGTLDTLKACAAFATRYPQEMPQDRRFLQSLMRYALQGSTATAAKHAVTALLAIPGKREMYAQDLLLKTTEGFTYGGAHFIARLATLSQVVLLAPREADRENDAILDIALKKVFLKARAPATEDSSAEEKPAAWVDDASLGEECHAKLWALKILVNRVRAHTDANSLAETSRPVYQLLNALVAKNGEISKTHDTPLAHRTRFRLAAARLLLKLSATSRAHEELLTAADFNRLAYVAQDSVLAVRASFISKVQKYLGLGRLPHRFYTIVFLQAFEPKQDLRESTVTWIRSRARFLTQKKSSATPVAATTPPAALPVMEALFARLLSVLAHHPDFSESADDLVDFAQYILFYLRSVANEDNLAVIYYVAQRVKQTRDAITPDMSQHLYCLSDLAQAVIRRYEDVHGWSMQVWPGKVGLPSSLFKAFPGHAVAQEIASQSFLPAEVLPKIDALVKATATRPSKRKADHLHPAHAAADNNTTEPAAKKVKSRAADTRKPKPNTTLRLPSRPRRAGNAKAAGAAKPTPRRRRRVNGNGADADGEDDHDGNADNAKASGPSSLVERRRSNRTAATRKVTTYAENSESESEGESEGEEEEVMDGDDADDSHQDDEAKEHDDQQDAAPIRKAEEKPSGVKTDDLIVLLGDDDDDDDELSNPPELDDDHDENGVNGGGSD